MVTAILAASALCVLRFLLVSGDRSELSDEQTATPSFDPYLLAQVREGFGRVVYSHKTHEKQADICFGKHRWQQTVLIALTAIGSGTFLAAVVGLLGNPVLTSLATSSTALLVSWMSLGAKTFKFEQESDSHRGIAVAVKSTETVDLTGLAAGRVD